MTESLDLLDDGPGVGGTTRAHQRASDRVAINALVGFASLTVVISAVLFYSGWVRARATYGYFGVDVSMLNFSVSDYIVRGVSTATPVLIGAGILSAVAIRIDARLQPRLLAKPRFASGLARVFSIVGWGLVIVGFYDALIIGWGGSDPLGPVVMVIGFIMVAYAWILRIRYRSQNAGRLVVILACLSVLAFFWAVTAYANYVGIRTAKDFQAGLLAAPSVTVYSSDILDLDGPGIASAEIEAPNAAYQFRYTGLRLLVSSGGQYFLLPDQWAPGAGPVFVLPVAPAGAGNLNIRVQFQISGS